MTIYLLHTKTTEGTLLRNRSLNESNEEIRIYVRPNGARYVKARDVLGSPKGRAAVKAMAKLFNSDSQNECSDPKGRKS